MVVFEPTVSLGSILTVGAMIATGVGFVWALRADVRGLTVSQTILAERTKKIEEQLGTMTTVMVQLARQDERLNAMDRRMNDLSEGEGFKLPIRRTPFEHGGKT